MLAQITCWCWANVGSWSDSSALALCWLFMLGQRWLKVGKVYVGCMLATNVEPTLALGRITNVGIMLVIDVGPMLNLGRQLSCWYYVGIRSWANVGFILGHQHWHNVGDWRWANAGLRSAIIMLVLRWQPMFSQRRLYIRTPTLAWCWWFTLGQCWIKVGNCYVGITLATDV